MAVGITPLMSPSPVDVWVMSHLAGVSSRSPLLNLIVEAGIETHLLGGIWYAAAVFVLWTECVRTRQRSLFTGLLTIVGASLLAGALSLVAGLLISWTPPRNLPGLAHLYPEGLWPNVNTNSFPSQSTAVYGAISTCTASLRRRLGIVLWVVTVAGVALPRVYVGGHYPADVLGGLAVGLAASMIAPRLAPRRLSDRIAPILDGGPSRVRVLLVLLFFAWTFEVATGFHEVVWLLAAFRHHVLGATWAQ